MYRAPDIAWKPAILQDQVEQAIPVSHVANLGQHPTLEPPHSSVYLAFLVDITTAEGSCLIIYL